MTNSSDPDTPEYTAADVKKAAGVSYRQLSDWEKKGVIDPPRQGATGWRKFTPREVFTLMVLREIRDRFGVPAESLAWVRKYMLQPQADHFREAVRIMGLGMTVMLLTDLSSVFIMDSDAEFEDLLHLGYFRHDEPEAYIFLKLNPIVNRLLACLKNPIKLEIDDRVYSAIRNARGELQLQSAEELEVLRLIREGCYKQVVVHLRDGNVVRVETEAERTVSDNAALAQLIEENGFQTVEVKKHDGKVIRVVQRKQHKFGKGARSSTNLSDAKEPRREP